MQVSHAKWTLIALTVLAQSASGQQAVGDSERMAAAHAASTVVLIEHCTKVDALLRRLCARIGAAAPVRIREHCDGLPSETFEARTAQLHRAFRETNRQALTAAEPELARQRAEAERLFARDNAHLLAPGPFSGMDLFRLRSEVDVGCRNSERLLAPRPRSPFPVAPPASR